MTKPNYRWLLQMCAVKRSFVEVCALCVLLLCCVVPHQPRLDWQMWFAALGSYQHNPWFLNLVYRLLMNERDGLCDAFSCNGISACRLVVLLHWWFYLCLSVTETVMGRFWRDSVCWWINFGWSRSHSGSGNNVLSLCWVIWVCSQQLQPLCSNTDFLWMQLDLAWASGSASYTETQRFSFFTSPFSCH